MTTKEFIQYASERPELCEKISICNNAEEGYDLAKANGVTDDFDTFKKVMSETKKEIETLNEDDLVQVNAAGTLTTVVTSVGTASMSAATAAMAAGGSAAGAV